MSVNPLSTLGGPAGVNTNPLSSIGSRGGGTTSSGAFDPNSSEGLLAIANAQGGSIAQTANELAHPTTGILSTVGQGVKHALKGFMDVLAVPQEVLVGAVSSDYTIGQAIDKHIKPSDVLFGGHNPQDTTMQKVGGFLVRTAADIMLDPLTYLTFGASAGVAGVRAATRVTLGEEAAAIIGKTAGEAASVSSEGQQLYSVLKKVEAQSKGLTSLDQLSGAATIAKDISGKTGLTLAESYDFTKNELQKVLSETIDAPLNIDFAKKAMSNLMERHPQLAETLIDKGGIKYFGQTILSGQRISSAIKMVPGMTALDHFTTPMRNSVNALFDTRMIKQGDTWIRLPEEYTQFEQAAKDLAESMKDNRINNLKSVIDANNLGKDEARFLFASVEARKIPTDERLANAYKQLMGFNEEEFKALRGAGIPISYLDKHVPHMLVNSPTKLLPFTLPPSEKVGASLKRTLEGSVFNSDTGQLDALEGAVLGKDAIATNKILGEMKNAGFEIFDDNIVSALAKRSVDNARSITTRNFMDGLAKNFSATAEHAPEGWVPLNVGRFSKEDEFLTKIGKSAETLRFHPAVAARVEKFLGAAINDDATSDAMKAYDSLQNLWKASVTSVFPSFHGRNALSNVFLHFNDIGLHSLNPGTHATATQLVVLDKKLQTLTTNAMKVGATEADKAAVHDLLTKKIFTDATGNPWTFGELRKVMKDNNVAFNRNIAGSIDINKGPNEIVNALFPMSGKDVKGLAKKALPISQDFKPFEIGRDVGNAIESQARALDFIVNLRATGDVSLAAARTKQFLFDYQNLTTFEKTFMRRVMPFYTFTRKNLEQQVNTFLTAPGRTAAQIHILSNIGDAISGQKLTDEEQAALPDWIKSGIALVKKKEGSQVEIYGSLATPLEAPFNAIQSNQILSSMSPLLKIPLEAGSGYDFFRGKPISEVTNATAYKNAPKAVQDLIGYTEVTGKKADGTKYTLYMSLRPEMMHFIGALPPTSRVLTTLGQLETENVSTQSKTLQQLIGLKPYSFDIQQEQQKRENELKSKLQGLLTTAGVTATFKRTYIPKDTTQ